MRKGDGIMSGRRSSREARDQLSRFDISLDDVANGVPLSTRHHRSMHTATYDKYVNRLLEAAQTKEDALKLLELIKKDLTDADQQNIAPPWERQ